LLHFPAFAVFQPPEEEILERVQGRLSSKAIINGLVIFVRFEPEFVGVGKEEQAEDQEDDDKSEGGVGHMRLKVGRLKRLNVQTCQRVNII